MSIARHTSYNFLGAVAPIAVTIVVTPFYLQAIGVERYGVLAIFWTLLNSLGFFSLGMGPAVAQRLGAIGEGSPEERSQLVWTALLTSLVAGLLGSTAVLLIGRIYFSEFASTPGSLQAEISAALPWLAASFTPALISGAVNGALQGRSRFGLLNLIQVGVTTLTSLVPLGIAHWKGPELTLLVKGVLAVNIAAVIVQLFACWKVVPLQRRRPTSKADLRRLLTFGGWVSATGLLQPLVSLIDRFLIGAMKGPAAVTAYVLPYSLVQRLVLLPASLTSAALPRFSISEAAEEQRLQDLSLRALTALLTPLAIAGMALLGPFLHVWVGSELAQAGSPAGYILIVGFWIHGISHAASSVLLGRGRPDIITKQVLAYILPYFAILYILTDEFGIVGAASAWTLRSLFDPIQFLFTRPSRNGFARTGVSAVLVIAAMATSLCLPWNGFPFWALMAMFLAFSISLEASFWRERAASVDLAAFRS